jgi:Ca2+-binding EF-hand superfamily protein
MYTDGHGSGKMMMATTTSKVTAEDPLVARFDDNNNGMIDRSEVLTAIQEYLADNNITRTDVLRLIALYLNNP